MFRSRSARLLAAAILALVLVVVAVTPAGAANGDCAPGALCFPAGTDCANFDLQIQLSGSGRGVYQEFLAEDGNIVHVLGAPRDNALVFTNLSSGATLDLTPDEALVYIMLNPDDSRTEVATGHSIIVISPLYGPARPSTMLYAGRVIYVVAMGEVFRVFEASENATDVCAALSG